MIAGLALVVGIVLGLILRPTVPTWLEPYLPIAVVAALDAVFGGVRARLDGIFDAKVFVVSFVSNVLVAALIVFLGDKLGVGAPAVDRGRRRARHPHLRQRRRHPPAPVPRMMAEPRRLPGAAPARHALGRASIGVLTLLLGFAIAVQVHANSSTDACPTLRDDDLDRHPRQPERPRRPAAAADRRACRRTCASCRTPATGPRPPEPQAAAQAQALGILLGTLPATGPGRRRHRHRPGGKLDGEDLLDVVEELRGAGAEAMQVGAAAGRHDARPSAAPPGP